MTDAQITLVTGASRGIGYATAKALAASGHRVVATARTQGGLEALDDDIKAEGGSCTLVPMDLRDFDSIDRLGEALLARFGRLDGLFVNAAVLGDITPANHVTPKDWAQIMDVNLTAPYRLIRALDPLLRQSDSGRAVFVTSSVARRPRAYWGAYAASKSALETLALCWAEEVGDITPIRVGLLDPGGTRTQMRAKAFPGEDASTLPDPADVAQLAAHMLGPDWDDHGGLLRYRDWAANPA